MWSIPICGDWRFVGVQPQFSVAIGIATTLTTLGATSATSITLLSSAISIIKMDPVLAFGIAAGVAQFAELAAKVSQSLFEYLQSVKQAPKLSLELQQEACVISLLLKELKSALESMNDLNITSELSENFKFVVVEFSETMIDMESRAVMRKGELMKRLKWPFTDKGNEKYLERLERYKSTFTLALTIIQR